MKESCAKNFCDIDTARASMSQNILKVFLRKKSIFPFQQERTTAIPQTKNYINLRQNIRKCEAWASIFVEMIAQTSPCPLKPRAALCERFSAMPSMIPCALCVHLLVSSEYPAYAVYSHILCRQKPAHGFSFFFLERLSSFFLKRRKKDADQLVNDYKKKN